MITGVAFCPQPPILLPEVAAGAAPELDDVRAACDAALRRVLEPAVGVPPHRVVLVCADRQGTDVRTPEADAVASLRGLGLDRSVPLDPDRPHGAPDLPVGAGVGAYLLGRAGWTGARVALLVRRGLDPQACARIGADLAAGPVPTVVLALGDGAACHGEKAPGYVDPDSEPFDRAVAAALDGVDTAALAGLDPARCDRLLVAGREAWQVAAGAARPSLRGEDAAVASAWRGTVDYQGSPYGVGYLVATWLPGPAPR